MGMIMMAAVCHGDDRGGYAHRRYGPFCGRHQYRVEHPEPLHHFPMVDRFKTVLGNFMSG